MSPVPIYTPGWRETMRGKVSCLRKHHDCRGWASNHRPSELKSNALTTPPPRPHMGDKRIHNYFMNRVTHELINSEARSAKWLWRIIISLCGQHNIKRNAHDCSTNRLWGDTLILKISQSDADLFIFMGLLGFLRLRGAFFRSGIFGRRERASESENCSRADTWRARDKLLFSSEFFPVYYTSQACSTR